MEHALWQAERLREFGPNPFSIDRNPVVDEVHGARPRTLKAGVRARCENIPGIYGMLDEHGVLIYVGKSKRLRTRLLSYFSPKVRNKKPGRLIRQSHSILWEPGTSEFAALLRELQLIQYWQPRFNVKDIPHRTRATFVCLGRPTAPGVLLSSDPAKHVLARFGPIYQGRKLGRAVEALNRFFLLRDCPNSQVMGFSDQSQLFPTDARPGCLRYELQTCLGPCVAACSQGGYFEKVQAAQQFLEGRNDKVLKAVAERMEQASRDRQFELAARHRDDLVALYHLRERLDTIRAAQRDYHFVYPVEGESNETLWYLIRGGRVAAVTKPPTSAASAKSTRQLIDQTFASPPPLDDLTTKRPDTLLLVTSWFQQNPDEKQQTLTPAETKKRCQWRNRPR